MKEKKRAQEPAQKPETSEGDPRFRVYGLNLVAKMLRDTPPEVVLHCPKGMPIQYGVVVSRGDGFDAQADEFREMPDLGALVAFEETTEGVEGHYFYLGQEEFRVLHLDIVNIAFPPGAPEPEN